MSWQGRTGSHRVALFREGADTLDITTMERVAREGAHREVRPYATLRPFDGAQLQALACAVQRLSPSHRDPERFHMDRSEIVAELRRLARSMVKQD